MNLENRYPKFPRPSWKQLYTQFSDQICERVFYDTRNQTTFDLSNQIWKQIREDL